MVARATIAAAGDVLLHDSLHRFAGKRGYGALFERVATLVSSADLSFANLETPVTKDPETEPEGVIFNAPPDVLAALRGIGVDVVSVANNHAYDQGRKGLAETLKHLDAADIAFVGAGRTRDDAWRPRSFTVNGIRVAMLAFTSVENYPGRNLAKPEKPQIAVWDEARAVEAVALASSSADAVIVSMHWGVEYEPAPIAMQETAAKKLVDAGALAVIGHHPHVLQPIERYGDGVILYSLGNFVSGQSAGWGAKKKSAAPARRRQSALAWITIVQRAPGARAEIAAVEAIPLWMVNDGMERSGPRKRERGVVTIDDALAELRAALPALTGDARKSAEKWIAILEERRADIRSTLGEAYVAPPPQP